MLQPASYAASQSLLLVPGHPLLDLIGQVEAQLLHSLVIRHSLQPCAPLFPRSSFAPPRVHLRRRHLEQDWPVHPPKTSRLPALAAEEQRPAEVAVSNSEVCWQPVSP